jgi:hypothetical protein
MDDVERKQMKTFEYEDSKKVTYVTESGAEGRFVLKISLSMVSVIHLAANADG